MYICLLNDLYLLFYNCVAIYANIQHVYVPSSSFVFFSMTVIKSPHTGYLVAPAKNFYGRDTA